MKTLIFIIFLTLPLTCLSQKQAKETIYLFFNEKSMEKCLVAEEGKGYTNIAKYRKEYIKNALFFKICNESFAFNSKKKSIDTCSAIALQNIKFVDLEYINKKKSKNVLRYNPFEKIYIVEKIPKNKILKYEVVWIDDWVMVDD